MKNFTVIAHRGFSQEYPENTRIAFQKAIELGVDMIELDVHLSKDRQLVVHHDPQLGRTAPGKGRLREKTWEELSQLDVGSWFGTQFSQERMLTLEQVLELTKGKVQLNIEIKAEAYEEGDLDDTVEKQVLALVQQKGMVDEVLISSFETRCLRRIYSLPHCPRIGLLEELKEENEILERIQELRPYSYNFWEQVITPELVQLVQQEGVLVYLYTVNDPKKMKEFLDMGIDGIFTDAADQLLHVSSEFS